MTSAEVLSALRTEPAGITTRALAARMRQPRYAVHSHISKLAAYGKIEKVPIPGYRQKSLYRLKVGSAV